MAKNLARAAILFASFVVVSSGSHAVEQEYNVNPFDEFDSVKPGAQFVMKSVERRATPEEAKLEKQLEVVYLDMETSNIKQPKSLRTDSTVEIQEAKNPNTDLNSFEDPQLVVKTQKFIKPAEEGSTDGRDLGIFLPDERVNANPRNFPANVVGQLWWDDGKYYYLCTATLVGSRYTLLTAGHCVKDTPAFWNTVRFVPGYKSNVPGKFSATSFSGWGYATVSAMVWIDISSGDGAEAPQNPDMAVLHLKPLSSAWINSYMGWVSFPTEDIFVQNKFRVSMVSYPSDSLGVEKYQALCFCTFAVGIDVHHSCDSFSGASGASIYNTNNKVILVHKAGLPAKLKVYTETNANWASPLRPLATFIRKFNKETN